MAVAQMEAFPWLSFGADSTCMNCNANGLIDGDPGDFQCGACSSPVSYCGRCYVPEGHRSPPRLIRCLRCLEGIDNGDGERSEEGEGIEGSENDDGGNEGSKESEGGGHGGGERSSGPVDRGYNAGSAAWSTTNVAGGANANTGQSVSSAICLDDDPNSSTQMDPSWPWRWPTVSESSAWALAEAVSLCLPPTGRDFALVARRCKKARTPCACSCLRPRLRTRRRSKTVRKSAMTSPRRWTWGPRRRHADVQVPRCWRMKHRFVPASLHSALFR